MLCLAFILVFSMMFTTGVVMAEPETAAETAAETPETTADGGILTELPDPVFELVAETEKVALYADKKLGEIKFVDKVTGLINMGSLIQIGKIFKNDELVDDDIENYEEILLSDFVKNNESNYINKIK